MSVASKLSRLYHDAPRLRINESSKLVLMSDCHRGDGSNADDYMKNQNIAFHALRRYYEEGFTYIELGDGDELWENRRFPDIAEAHGNTLELIKRFYDEGRLYMLYGNHDLCKRSEKWVRKNMSSYERKNQRVPLFPGIRVLEGVVLEYGGARKELLLLHGHQADFLNCELWRVSRFLVRYLWRPLELIGVKNPLSAQKNRKMKDSIERKLTSWVQETRTPLLAGHTHRSVFPLPGEPPYFNDGCCVHPRCVTALEIANGKILLVKWSVFTDSKGRLYVGRSLLAGPRGVAEVV